MWWVDHHQRFHITALLEKAKRIVCGPPPSPRHRRRRLAWTSSRLSPSVRLLVGLCPHARAAFESSNMEGKINSRASIKHEASKARKWGEQERATSETNKKNKKQERTENNNQKPQPACLLGRQKKNTKKNLIKWHARETLFFFSMSIFLSSREEKLIKNKTNNNNESECAELSVTPAGPFAREEKESKEQIRGTQRSGAKAHQKHFSLFNPQIWHGGHFRLVTPQNERLPRKRSPFVFLERRTRGAFGGRAAKKKKPWTFNAHFWRRTLLEFSHFSSELIAHCADSLRPNVIWVQNHANFLVVLDTHTKKRPKERLGSFFFFFFHPNRFVFLTTCLNNVFYYYS